MKYPVFKSAVFIRQMSANQRICRFRGLFCPKNLIKGGLQRHQNLSTKLSFFSIAAML